MLATLLSILAVVVMIGCLVAIPFGLPGVWGMVGVAALSALFGRVALTTLLILFAIAAVAEVAEFLVVKRMGTRFGGSGRAFWGAVLGGVIGAVVGTPVPVLGSLIGVFLGTFVGAGAVTVLEGRSLVEAGTVGWGALLGRAVAVALKGAAGIVVLLATTAALFF